MKMTFRWYGSAIDPIPLKYVKQIPGMTGLMGLLDKPAGVDWPEEEFAALKKEVKDAGLEIEVIESVNVHEDVKIGLPSREEYIANYISTIRMLAKHGVKVIVYNFMPVFDWLRTDLARVIPEDGSNSLYFDEKDLGEMGPLEIVRKTAEDSHGFTLPGWEPERLALLFNPDGTPTARTGKILAATPMGRFGDSEKELSGAVLFLLNNDAASFITGVTIPIDGGFSAYSGV